MTINNILKNCKAFNICLKKSKTFELMIYNQKKYIEGKTYY